MVFITPFLFQGNSVMVDVATAGGPSSSGGDDPACYCRLHPDDEQACGAGESMPIVLRFPRFDDWRGGSSLLGLGDIIIPGLLVLYAVRADLALARLPWRGPYVVANVIAYVLGLFLAFVAVYLSGLGQPALLYLIPAILSATFAVAWRRGEVDVIWRGLDAPDPQPSAALATHRELSPQSL